MAQFCCTSLWFAGNAVIQDLMAAYHLPAGSLGYLTSAVQVGFILGTLLFAILMIADRYLPSRVFLICALLGALANASLLIQGQALWTLLVIRMLTGFFLAGIYPIGMKIASDYFDKGLGKSLGLLVGALVLGTAFPHALRSIWSDSSWTSVIVSTSILAAVGGVMMVALVGEGPYRRASQQLDISAFYQIFRHRSFRSAAMGYFGHMWELYAFWAFVPVYIAYFIERHPYSFMDISLTAFVVIGIGSLSCTIAGYWSVKRGPASLALFSLIVSGVCCVVSHFALDFAPVVFLIFLLISVKKKLNDSSAQHEN